MISILVTGDIVYTGNEILRNGYVYVRGGRVIDLGEGSPPEEYTYATLVLGGPGRIIVPGLRVVADPLLYPFRHTEIYDSPCELYRQLSPNEAFKLSLPGIYTLHMLGATSIAIRYVSENLPYSLKNSLDADFDLYKVECGDSGSNKLESGDVIVDPLNNLQAIKDPLDYSRIISERLGKEPPTISKNSIANIAVFNARSPPLFTVVEYSSRLDPAKLYGRAGWVESLLYGENILVDSGEHIYIVEKHLREAYSIATNIASRYSR
ncbi:MAG: hypothetical protein GSR72_07230 [Desulfurococcales archaeon]|nr:hypothetical protein [Desulfurococcales archaeon]